MKTKIIVTGCAGFIGYHLCKHLLKNPDYEIYGLDNFTKKANDAEFKNLLKNKNFNFLNHDLKKPLSNTLPNDFQYIFHLAAYNGTQNFYTRPYDVLINSTLPNFHIINFALKQKKLKRIVYSSSSEVYSDSVSLGISDVPTDENVPISFNKISNVRWSYAIGKLTGESALFSTFKQHALPFCIIRYHNIYGPRMGIKHVIPDYILRALNGKFQLNGFKNSRSFLYIKDAIHDTIELGFHKKNLNGIFNIGSNFEITMYDLAIKINKLMNFNKKIDLKPSPKGSVKRRCPKLDKFNSLLVPKKRTTLNTGLKLTLKY